MPSRGRTIRRVRCGNSGLGAPELAVVGGPVRVGLDRTGPSIGGRGPSRCGVRDTQDSQCGGTSPTGSACRRRKPSAMARTACSGCARQNLLTADSAARPAVSIHCPIPSSPEPNTRGAGCRPSSQSRRSVSRPRSRPAECGLHLTYRSPSRQVWPPSSFRHTSSGATGTSAELSSDSSRRTGAGTSPGPSVRKRSVHSSAPSATSELSGSAVFTIGRRSRRSADHQACRRHSLHAVTVVQQRNCPRSRTSTSAFVAAGLVKDGRGRLANLRYISTGGDPQADPQSMTDAAEAVAAPWTGPTGPARSASRQPWRSSALGGSEGERQGGATEPGPHPRDEAAPVRRGHVCSLLVPRLFPETIRDPRKGL